MQARRCRAISPHMGFGPGYLVFAQKWTRLPVNAQSGVRLPVFAKKWTRLPGKPNVRTRLPRPQFCKNGPGYLVGPDYLVLHKSGPDRTRLPGFAQKWTRLPGRGQKWTRIPGRGQKWTRGYLVAVSASVHSGVGVSLLRAAGEEREEEDLLRQVRFFGQAYGLLVGNWPLSDPPERKFASFAAIHRVAARRPRRRSWARRRR